jgi:NitT/TauT family transport system permease protein
VPATLDDETPPQAARGGLSTRAVRILIPLAVGVLFLLAWQWAVEFFSIPKFVLPAPSLIAKSFSDSFSSLLVSFLVTFKVTVGAFFLALFTGIAIAVIFVQNRAIELALFPYAVILQVTPVVAIAPLIIIWVGFDNIEIAVLILAWIVAFFPILSNTTIGLSSADHNLRDLFALYGASRWQVFRYLQFPTALPFILAGARISGGLALIGAVVAEFVAGSGSATGLAWRIIEAGNRLNIPGMFAALILLSLLGIAIFFCLTWVQQLLLGRWHESATTSGR